MYDLHHHVCCSKLLMAKYESDHLVIHHLSIEVFKIVLNEKWTGSLVNVTLDWDRQNPTQIVTEMCGFITFLSGNFLLHRTEDMVDGESSSLFTVCLFSWELWKLVLLCCPLAGPGLTRLPKQADEDDPESLRASWGVMSVLHEKWSNFVKDSLTILSFLNPLLEIGMVRVIDLDNWRAMIGWGNFGLGKGDWLRLLSCAIPAFLLR